MNDEERAELEWEKSRPKTAIIMMCQDIGNCLKVFCERAGTTAQGNFELHLSAGMYELASKEFEHATRYPRSGVARVPQKSFEMSVDTPCGLCTIRERKPKPKLKSIGK